MRAFPFIDYRAVLSANGSRRVDALECVVSVLLAVAVAHAMNATHVAWAAFSGFMVMRGHVAETLLRGSLRIIGTLAGAVLAVALAPFAMISPAVAALVLMLVGLPTLYAALLGKRAYAWLFVGLTVAMVLLDKVQHPAMDVVAIARMRTLEVAIGTVACVLVSLVSTLTLRRRWPAVRTLAAAPLRWHRQAFRHACQGAIALALLPLLDAALGGGPALAQSAITIMAAMLVPVDDIGPSGFKPVSTRLLHRAAGCVAGAAFGSAVLLLSGGIVPVLVLGTALAVTAGKLIENSGLSTRYVGTQFVLASLMVLVPDSYANAHLEPGLARLLGVLIGIAVLEPVLLIGHFISSLARHRQTN